MSVLHMILLRKFLLKKLHAIFTCNAILEMVLENNMIFSGDSFTFTVQICLLIPTSEKKIYIWNDFCIASCIGGNILYLSLFKAHLFQVTFNGRLLFFLLKHKYSTVFSRKHNLRFLEFPRCLGKELQWCIFSKEWPHKSQRYFTWRDNDFFY